MIKCALLGAVMTVVVAATHSLWPAIVLHSAIDLMAGWVGWQLFREVDDTPPALEPTAER
jgi:membrane protease YdiL (CAAX protease family)